ncbi:hypothetical protein [Intrasporangium calvum]|uniref:hypothetical protein n=1 Tax=Intrasporangium calvum TaxID=53358 RepID=UPI0019026547|nr:hypothetical protein [Intrasporangium calvum]
MSTTSPQYAAEHRGRAGAVPVRARQRWPGLSDVSVRARAGFTACGLYLGDPPAWE